MGKAVQPQEVMRLLNTLFGAYDRCTDHYQVHKVETAGDQVSSRAPVFRLFCSLFTE